MGGQSDIDIYVNRMLIGGIQMRRLFKNHLSPRLS